MKLHKFDTISFLAGLLITAIGLAFLIPPGPEDVISLIAHAGVWFWPILFLSIGVAILVPLVSVRGEDEADEENHRQDQLR